MRKERGERERFQIKKNIERERKRKVERLKWIKNEGT